MIYFAILFVLVALTYFEFVGKDFHIFSNEQIEKTIYISISIFLTLFAGLRFETGRDWGGYVYFFNTCEHLKSGEIFEYGYYLLNLLFRCFTHDYYMMQFAITIFCCWIIFGYIYKKSSKPIFTLLIYYMFWYTWLNMAIQRQLLAVAILILGMRYVEQRKLWHWCAFVFIAMQFHISAIVALPLYYTTGIRISRRNALFALLCIFVFGFVGLGITQWLINHAAMLSVLPIRLRSLVARYVNTKFGRRVGYNTIFGLLGHTIIYLLVIWQYDNKSKNTDNKYLLNFLIAILCIQFGRNFEILGRFQYYYNLCGCGMLSYNLLDNRAWQSKHIKFNKRTQLLFCFLTLTLFIFIYTAAFYMQFYSGDKAAGIRRDYFDYKTFLFRE